MIWATMRLPQWLTSNTAVPAAVSAVGVAGCGVGLGLVSTTGGRIAWGVGLAFCALLPVITESSNALGQNRRAADRATRKLLHALAIAFGHPERHVRTNVMLFTSDRQRRRVDKSTAFNMTREGEDDDTDADLELGATAGVSGKAVTNRKPAFGDLSLVLNPGGPDWGLTSSQKAQVRQTLRCVLSCPVFDPDNPTGDLLGTLQIDSDDTMEAVGFDQPAKRQMAQQFADAIALLQKTQA
jgi:hypothetical protein